MAQAPWALRPLPLLAQVRMRDPASQATPPKSAMTTPKVFCSDRSIPCLSADVRPCCCLRRDSPVHPTRSPDFDPLALALSLRPAPLRPQATPPGRAPVCFACCLLVVGASRARSHHGSGVPQRLQGERVTGRDREGRPCGRGKGGSLQASPHAACCPPSLTSGP